MPNEEHEIFSNVDGWLWTTMDNRSRVVQARKKDRKPYNVLSGADVKKLFESPELRGSTPRSFLCSLMFGISMLTAMWQTEFSLFEISEFTRKNLKVLKHLS